MAPRTLSQVVPAIGDPRLGRVAEFDAQSLNYPMRELTATTRTPRSKRWTIRQRLNQLQTPRCVGYSVAMEIGMQPYYHNVTDFLADIVYAEAQKIDYWPGEGYAGTSVIAGMKTAQKLGFYHEYRWALPGDPVNDIVLCLSHIGPVEMGTTWYTGMYQPDASGVVYPTGQAVGGHAYVLSEYDHQKKRVYSPNTWGDAGFWLGLDSLEKLIYEDGEAVVPVKRD